MKKIFFLFLFVLLIKNNALLSQCLKAGAGSAYGTGISRTSGNTYLDNQIGQLVEKINSIYGTSAQFFFYNDGQQSNAYASSADLNIYIGRNFLSETLNGKSGITGVAFLLGHELGHVYQYTTRESNKFMSEELVKNSELQADFLSAYAISRLGLIDESNYELLLTQAMETGDVFFQQQDHHGTPSERKASAIWGYYNRDESLDDAYAKSYTYCCPQAEDKNRLVYTLNIYNGLKYYIIYGGAVCTKDNMGQYQKVAQMASTGNVEVPFTFEWSQNDASKNLFMNNNNQLLDYLGNVVGYVTKNANLSSSDSYTPDGGTTGYGGGSIGNSSSTNMNYIMSCSTSFCSTLIKVISDIDNSFMNIRDETDHTIYIYKSTLRFPEEQSSWINMTGNPSTSAYYHVNFYRGDDTEKSKSIYNSLKDKFESLGIALDEKDASYTNTQKKVVRIDLGSSKVITLSWLYETDKNEVSVGMKVGHN